jgi:parvulin-like peptidyl-prolyl isomerase
MDRKVILITLFILLLLCKGLLAADRIIAVVNKDSITQSEADAYLNVVILELSQRYKGKELEEKIKEEKGHLIARMIEDKIILQEARRKNLSARTDKVKYRLEQLKAAYDSEIDFENSLKEKGLTVRDLEGKLANQMIMRAVVEQEVRDKIIVSPDEVTRFYEKNKEAMFLQPESRAVDSLYLEDEGAIDKLSDDIKNGLDFVEAAKLYKCAYVRDVVLKNELRPEVRDQVFSLQINEVSKPIKVEKGVYIFKLLEILAPKLQTLPEVHDRIFNYLFEEKFAIAISKWLEDLKAKAYIVIK